MNFLSKIPAILIGAIAAITLSQAKIAIALDAQAISQKAQKFTVQIDGEEAGSGVIIEHKGNTYTVLTCWHVVDTPGKYQVIAADGRKYDIKYKQIKNQSGIDLAVLQFTSNQSYTVAELGDSEQINPGTNLYVTGYPKAFPGVPERSYFFQNTSIVSKIPNPKKGYELLFDKASAPGSSGGAIVDNLGRLVGINGKSISDANSRQAYGGGIPLQLYTGGRNSLKVPTNVKAPQDSLSVGQRKLKAGDYRVAIAEYSKALDSDSNNLEAYSERGLAYLNLEEYQKAIADYNKAIQLNLNYADAYVARGFAYGQQEEYEKAIADHNKAIQLNPQLAIAYVTRGVVYGELKEYQKAIVDFNKAIGLNSQYAEAYYSRGNIYLSLKEYQKAIADYNEAIRLNPQLATAYLTRGFIYYSLKEYQKAIADYNEAIRFNPQLAFAYVNRGVVYFYLEEHQKARKDLQKAADLFQQEGDTEHYQEAIDLIRKLP
jgi:tetratricopeptide (TPR) repeat protein